MQVIIRNFQSIKEAKLNIKGFTLLVGESSSGKSACMRALYSSTHNRFKQGHVRYGEDSAQVLIKFPEESREVLSVTRPWSGSVKMQLGSLQFSKINRTVPKEIAEFLNFGVLDVAGDNFSLNFHDQFQKPLLLEYSQKKVMDILSASKSLDDLQLTKDALYKIRLENSGAFKVVSGILDDSKVKLSTVKSKLQDSEELFKALISASDDLEYVESTLVFVDNLKSLQSQLDKIQTFISSFLSARELLESVVEQLQQVDSAISLLSSLCSVLSELPKVETEITFVSSKKRCYTAASSISDDISSINFKLQTLSSLSTDLQYSESIQSRIVELNDIVVNHICPVCHSKVE